MNKRKVAKFTEKLEALTSESHKHHVLLMKGKYWYRYLDKIYCTSVNKSVWCIATRLPDAEDAIVLDVYPTVARLLDHWIYDVRSGSVKYITLSNGEGKTVHISQSTLAQKQFSVLDFTESLWHDADQEFLHNNIKNLRVMVDEGTVFETDIQYQKKQGSSA